MECIKNDYESNLPQRTIEYFTFLDFLQEQKNWDNELVIISGDE